MNVSFTFSPNTTIFSNEVNTNFSDVVTAYNNHTDPPASSHPLGILLNNLAMVEFKDVGGLGGNSRCQIYQNNFDQLIFQGSSTVVGNTDYKFYFTHTALEFRLFGDEPGNNVYFYVPSAESLMIRTTASGANWHVAFLGATLYGAVTMRTNCNFTPASDNADSFGNGAPVLRYYQNHTTEFYGHYNAGPDVADRLWPHPDYKLAENDHSKFAETKEGVLKFKTIKEYNEDGKTYKNVDMRSTNESLSILDKGTVVVWKSDETGSGYAPSSTENDTKLVGVISTNPGIRCGSLYGDEEDIVGDNICLAGRIPCRVKGAVEAGDILTTGADGCAVKANNPVIGAIVGKALEKKTGQSEKKIMIWVGGY